MYTELILIGTILLVTFVGGVFFIISKAFNVEVNIYEQTAGGIVHNRKKAKKIERSDGCKLQFFSVFKAGKDYMALPTGDYFFLTKKRKMILNLYKDKAGNYQPIPLRWNEKLNPLFVPDDNDMRFWKTVMDKEADEAYKNKTWIEKYGGVITISILCATALIVLIVYGQLYFKGIKEVAQPLSGQMGGLTDMLGGLMGRGGV